MKLIKNWQPDVANVVLCTKSEETSDNKGCLYIIEQDEYEKAHEYSTGLCIASTLTGALKVLFLGHGEYKSVGQQGGV